MAVNFSSQVGLEFQCRLLNVNLGAVDRSTQREIEMFLVAIAKNPPIMNLDGFTNINRELFTAVKSLLIFIFLSIIIVVYNIMVAQAIQFLSVATPRFSRSTVWF